MTTFEVKDMTCGHCVSAIGKAIRDLDETAEVSFDLASKTVRVDSEADTGRLQAAIADAGYTPVLNDKAPVSPKGTSGGCCCGSR